MVSCAGGTPAASNAIGAPTRYNTCERACSKAKAARKEQRDEEEAREAKREAEIQAEIQKKCAAPGQEAGRGRRCRWAGKMRHPSSSQSMDGA